MYQLILIEAICLIYVLSRRKYLLRNEKDPSTKKSFKPILLLTLFCVFFDSGWDYFSYGDTHKWVFSNGRLIEDVCIWLMLYVRSYLLWRFVVWGIASFFIVKTVNYINASPKLFYPLFVMLPLLQVFCVTRNSMGHAVLFFAIALITYGNYKKSLKVIFAIILTIASYYMHKSMPLYFAIAMVAFVVPLNRKIIISSFVAFPFLYIGVSHYAEMFLGMQGLSENMVAAGNSYLDRDSELSLSTVGVITRTMEMFPILLILAYSVWNTIYHKYQLSYCMKVYLLYTYILIYASFLFLGQSSDFLHTRFWNAAQIPMSLFLGLYLIDKRNHKITKIFMYSLFISFLYTLIYRIYGWSDYGFVI